MKKEEIFKPRSDQVDFTNIRWTPVVNCVVQYKNKILLVKRNKNMRLYPGYWTGVSGFLDDKKSLKEKVEEELREELGIQKKNILSIKLGGIFDQEAKKYKKTWIVHAVKAEVSTDQITLDWEAENYQWLKPSEAMSQRLLPGFEEVLRALFRVK